MATAIAEKVRSLSSRTNLTQEQVGEIVGSSSKAVGRWHNGTATPQKESRRRLLELVYVAEALSKVMRPEDANLWIFSPNSLLDHDSPADRIKKGDYKAVVALIEAMAEGIVV